MKNIPFVSHKETEIQKVQASQVWHRKVSRKTKIRIQNIPCVSMLSQAVIYSLLSLQITYLLVGKINVKGILFCSSKISLGCVSFWYDSLLKVDSLKDYMKKKCFKWDLTNLISLLGHFRVEYHFLVPNWLFPPSLMSQMKNFFPIYHIISTLVLFYRFSVLYWAILET